MQTLSVLVQLRLTPSSKCEHSIKPKSHAVSRSTRNQRVGQNEAVRRARVMRATCSKLPSTIEHKCNSINKGERDGHGKSARRLQVGRIAGTCRLQCTVPVFSHCIHVKRCGSSPSPLHGLSFEGEYTVVSMPGCEDRPRQTWNQHALWALNDGPAK